MVTLEVPRDTAAPPHTEARYFTDQANLAVTQRLTSQQTQTDINARTLARPEFQTTTQAQRAILSPQPQAFGTTVITPATIVASLYGDSVAASIRQSLTGLAPDASELDIRSRLRQGNVVGNIVRFAHDVEAQFQQQYGSILTPEQIRGMAHEYVERTLDLQIEATIGVGNREGRLGHVEPVRVAMAVISEIMDGATQAGHERLATPERQQQYMHNLLQGATPEVQADALRAAVNLGWAASAIFGAAHDLALPQAMQMQLQQVMLQHTQELFREIRDRIKKQLEEQQRTNQLADDPELHRLERELEAITHYNPVRVADQLIREGRDDEALHVIEEQVGRLANFPHGIPRRISGPPLTEEGLGNH